MEMVRLAFACYTSKYASFSGRARRLEYWSFTGMYGLFLLVVVAIGLSSGLDYENPNVSLDYVILFLPVLVILISILPGIAVSIRRLHDMNFRGWWVIPLAVVTAIPYVGALMCVIVMSIRGTKGDNRFGADPVGFENPAADNEIFA